MKCHVSYRRLVAMLLLAWMTCSSNLPATTVIPPDFSTLVDRAELIVTGKVLSSRAEWANQGGARCIVTTVAFEVESTHKGQALARVELRFLGGTVGGTTMEVQGVPKFNVGERSILFVENNGRQFCPLVGVYHGKLLVARDAGTGREILLPHHGRPLTDVKEIGAADSPAAIRAAGKPDRGPLSVAEFVGEIQNELARRRSR